MRPLLSLFLIACGDHSEIGNVPIQPDQEDRNADGSFFTPSTQSFVRGHHWLDSVESVSVRAEDGLGSFRLQAGDDFVSVEGLELSQLVPRLHYSPNTPPDSFDALNLLLAEYSRNGLTVPYGERGDTAAHFETSLQAEIPWSLSGEFGFEPDARVRPLRFGVVNNCLAPGLWELTANDRAGELYHAWFSFPSSEYISLVAKTNALPEDFTAAALEWRTDTVPVDLARLRKQTESLGEVVVRLAPDREIGYSSQSSRRKISRNFVQVGEAAERRRPSTRMDLVREPVHLVDFVPPGKYDSQKRRTFDLSFLGTPRGATVHRVEPLTSYRWQTGTSPPGSYIELELDLTTRRIVLGNLPIALMVPQEDYAIHGFGVGVLSASTPAERRRLLLADGPAPSFAYLLDAGGENALNSHESGIEQVFIRAHVNVERPYWDVTITSFERIVDLVQLQVEMPEALYEEVRANSSRYVSPTYLTYRDDNLR